MLLSSALYLGVVVGVLGSPPPDGDLVLELL
jgi:hypothetical protein